MEEETICPSCLAQTDSSAILCQHCNFPLGTTATLDPVRAIQDEGHLLRKATEGRPKPIVLAGVWLLFLPTLAMGAYAAISLILGWSGFGGFVFFWTAVAIAYLSFAILYRVTRNYLTIPARR